jgi:hypothetical protein
VAQTILTFLAFSHRDPDALRAAESAFGWAMANMWDQRGFFYYRKSRLGTIRTSYMRWSQAWMLQAIAGLCQHSSNTAHS